MVVLLVNMMTLANYGKIILIIKLTIVLYMNLFFVNTLI